MDPHGVKRKRSEAKMAVTSVFFILLLTAAVSVIDFNFVSGLRDDQTTLYYTYSQAFASSFCEAGHFFGWNPWISSGSNEFANLPLPFSLTKLFAILFCDGGLGYLLGTFASLSVGAICIVRLCHRLGMNAAGQAAALALLLIFSRYFGLLESQPLYVAALVLNAQLSFAQKPQIFWLLINALVTGILINSHVAQGVPILIGLNIVFLALMSPSAMFRRLASASAVLWIIGIAMALPTLLPQIVDARDSSKIFSPRDENGGGLRFFQLSLLHFPAISFWMVGSIVATIVCWHTLSNTLRKLIVAACLIWIPTALFFSLQPMAANIAVVGKIITAVDPTRFAFAFRFACILMLALTASIMLSAFHGRCRIVPNSFSVKSQIFIWFMGTTFILLGGFGTKLSILLFVQLIILVVTVLGMSYHSAHPDARASPARQGHRQAFRNTYFGGKPLGLMLGAPILVFFAVSASNPHVLDGKLTFRLESPKPALEASARPPVFALESPEDSRRLLSFLGRVQAIHPWQVAELRDLRQPSGVYQSYAAYRISTIHGFRNIRPMRAHIFYSWLLDDLRLSNPAGYREMFAWGSFTYSYGSRYLTNLLSLMGAKYLIAPISDTDSRFTSIERAAHVKIYENRTALERVFFSPGIKILPNLDRLGLEMKAATLEDLQAKVLLLESDANDLSSKSQLYSSRETALVSLRKFEPDNVIVHTQSANNGFLVMTQNFHRGWRAFVNGVEQPILPAYYAFQAVALKPGSSVVEFRYSDPLVTYGLWTALLAILLCTFTLYLARDTLGLGLGARGTGYRDPFLTDSAH